MVKFVFKYKSKTHAFDVKELKNVFSKALGLMFRLHSKPLLFYFKRTGIYSIHSFFCRPFVAVWLLDSKVIEVKMVKGWRSYIVPKSSFNLLLEIPLENPCSKVFYRRDRNL